MELVGIKLVETVFEGNTYKKYECHLIDRRKKPGVTGATVHVYDVRMKVLEDGFAFKIGGKYDFLFDEGKVVAVYEVKSA